MMGSITNWHPRACCTGCDFTTYAPHGDAFFVHVEVCPKCGEPKSDGLRFGNSWPVRTMRWIPTTQKWFRPSTRVEGHWETRT